MGIADFLLIPGSPFPITLGPEEAVTHRGWAAARDRLLAALSAGQRLILLLGAPGTGKTQLLQEVARMLRAAGTDVLLQPRGDLPIDPAAVDTSIPGTRRRRVVLIDEADRMNEAALGSLGRLGGSAVVLAGMPDPGDDQRRGVPTAAAVVVRLAALPRDEIGPFVTAWLVQSGLGAGLLTAEAMMRLAEHSGGIPRVLTMLAGASMFLARAEGAPCVDAAHIDQAAAFRDSEAGMGAPAPAAAVMPGIVPSQQAGIAWSSVLTPPASSPEAGTPLPVQATDNHSRRRRSMAALGVAVGIAAACGGLMAWHGGHSGRALPVMTAALPVPPSPEPVVPAPEPGKSTTAPPAGGAAVAELATPPEPEIGAHVASPAPIPWALPAASIHARPEPAPTLAAGFPPQGEALPFSAPAHVVLRYPRGSAEAAARAVSLARVLRVAGIDVEALVPGSQRNARPGADFFFVEDEDTAAAVLKAAGVPGKANLASAAGLNAAIRPGLIELTVPPGNVEVGGRLASPNPGRS